MLRLARPFAIVLAAVLALALGLTQAAHVAHGGDSGHLPAGMVMTALGPAELCGAANGGGGGHDTFAAHCPDCAPCAGPALLAPGASGLALPAFGAAPPSGPGAERGLNPARLAAAPLARGPPRDLT